MSMRGEDNLIKVLIWNHTTTNYKHKKQKLSSFFLICKINQNQLNHLQICKQSFYNRLKDYAVIIS